MRACGRTRSERPHLSDDASGRSRLWSRPCPPRRRPGSCRRMPERSGRIEALAALVAQRGPDGLCGALPDEDTRPGAVVERHEPSGLGGGGAACGELAVLWSGNRTRLLRPQVGQSRSSKRRRYSPGVRPVTRPRRLLSPRRVIRPAERNPSARTPLPVPVVSAFEKPRPWAQSGVRSFLNRSATHVIRRGALLVPSDGRLGRLR